MAQSTISIRIDNDLKQEMEQTCKELGLNLTTAFTIFAKKVAREKRIPFDVAIDPFYSAKNIEAIKKSVKQIEDGKTVTLSFDELEKLENE